MLVDIDARSVESTSAERQGANHKNTRTAFAFRPRRFNRAAKNAFRSDTPAHVLFLAFWIPSLAVSSVDWHSTAVMLLDYSRITFAALLLFSVAVALPMAIVTSISRSPRRPLRDLRLRLARLDLGRAVVRLALIAQVPLFLTAFTSVKIALSRWMSFRWDVRLANIDRWLHLGVDPGVALVRAIPDVRVLQILEFTYTYAWNLLWYAMLFWVVFFQSAERIRTRFLACFVLTWAIVGNLVAGAFLSAGPAFYGRISGDHGRFHAIVTHLSQTAGSGATLDFQVLLWELHAAGQEHFASGISAFPSMHVALPALITCFAWEKSRWFGAASGLFTLVILLSSAYLGWHYLIDGYVAISIVFVIYRSLLRLNPPGPLQAPRSRRCAASSPSRRINA